MDIQIGKLIIGGILPCEVMDDDGLDDIIFYKDRITW
jgi:hypothetical protein